MGTRSLTVIKDHEGTEIMVMYRQMDGYIDGHGHELADFCKDIEIVNGYGFGPEAKTQANGMGCLAAQIVAHFKEGVGSIYIYPAGSRDCGEEYTYTVRPSGKDLPEHGNEQHVLIEVVAYDEIIFSGTADELTNFKENAEEPEAA